MIIHRTYSEEGTKTIHIPYAPRKDYHRIMWGGVRLQPYRLSIANLINVVGRHIEVTPQENNAHS